MSRERILLSIMFVTLLFASVGITIVQAEYRVQPAKERSGICTNDGVYWDNDFAKLVNDTINGNCGGMIFTFGQCYGGGMIDDLNKTVNAKMALSSASRHNEPSWGCPRNKPIAKTDEDCYLKAWAEAINKSPVPTMKQAYETARKNDPAGPKRTNEENPQYKSNGTNADNLKLGNKSGATSYYYAILFVGGPDEWRHWNDLERIHKVLKNKYGYPEDKMYIMYNNKKLPDGKNTPNWVDNTSNSVSLDYSFRSWLKPKMNKSCQFFFWCGDHGDNSHQGKVKVKAPKAVNAGETFDAIIAVDYITDFNAGQFDLSFDSSVVNVTGVADGSLDGETIPVSEWERMDGDTIRVILEVSGIAGVSGAGNLATISFAVVGETGDKSVLDMDNGMLVNTEAEAIPAEWINDEVIVGPQ